MSIWTNIRDSITGLFANKSFGEAAFAKMVGGTGTGAWGYGIHGWDRQELVNHYKGFNYLAIQPIMKEISGMTPHAAFRRDGHNVREARQKALSTGDWNTYRQIGSKFLTKYELSKAIAPIQTHEELEPVSNDHPAIRLLRNPNGPDTAVTFFRKLIMFWRLYGEFYIWLVPPMKERVTGVKMPPVEMWVLPSHWMWPHHDEKKERLFDYYEVRPYAGSFPMDSSAGIQLGFFPGGTGHSRIPADQIIYYGEPNPTGYFNGYSPLTAISHWIDCSDSIDRSRTAQFQNGAFPGVVIEFDKSVLEPDEGTIKRLEARIQQGYVGVKRNGRPMILSPGVKMKPMDNKPMEMGYAESADQIKDWVFAAQGTGQSIVGLVEQTTFNNVWGARANFYSNTIKPMCQLLGEIFTEKIARRFDPDLVIYWPDTTPVDPDLELRKLDTMLRNNVMVINEACAILGLEPKPWGDKPLDMLKMQEWAQPQAQPGQPQAPGQPPQDQAKPEPPKAPESPLNQPPGDDHPAAKTAQAADHMTNLRAVPSKNGTHRQHLLRNGVR